MENRTPTSRMFSLSPKNTSQASDNKVEIAQNVQYVTLAARSVFSGVAQSGPPIVHVPPPKEVAVATPETVRTGSEKKNNLIMSGSCSLLRVMLQNLR